MIKLIRKFFIYRQIEKLAALELKLQTDQEKNLNELLRLKVTRINSDRIKFLQEECLKAIKEIAYIQEEKKKVYFKLI